MANEQVIANLNLAKQYIDDAIVVLGGSPEPPEPPVGNEILVNQGDDLIAKINASPDGSTFKIATNFVQDLGDQTLPKGNITLVSAGTLPGKRVTKDLVGPQLKGSIKFKEKTTCRGIRFENGMGTTCVTAANKTTLDQCVVLGATGKVTHRGVAANAEDITITKCHIGNIYKDQDTQAVGCWEYTKRLKIQDCFLEASGENFMAGGSDSPTADAMPSDILIEDCHMFKPVEWMDATKFPQCSVKNLLELKAARNVIIRRCLMENNWAHGQSGNAIVFSIRNQNGKAVWSTIENVVFEDITIKHTGGGFGILGRDDNYDSGVMNNVVIRRVTIEDLDRTKWRRGSAAATGRSFNLSGGPNALIIEDVDTCIAPGKITSAIAFDQIEYPITKLSFNKVKMHEGEYGLTGEAPGTIGVEQITGHAPGYAWNAVTIQRGNSGRTIKYPAGTTLLPPVGAERRAIVGEESDEFDNVIVPPDMPPLEYGKPLPDYAKKIKVDKDGTVSVVSGPKKDKKK